MTKPNVKNLYRRLHVIGAPIDATTTLFVGKYHGARKAGQTASHAIATARAFFAERDCPLYPEDDWTHELENGWTLRLKLTPEWEFGTTLDDWLGDGYGHSETCDGFAGETAYSQTKAVRMGNGTVYVPSESWDYAERRGWYSKAGASRSVAHEMALAGMRDEAETWTQYAEGDKSFYMISVIVEDSDGCELGRDSLGCVDEDYIIGAILDHGMIDEAMSEAQESVDRDEAKAIEAHGACQAAAI